jgi:hypothetical protein
MPRTGLAYEKPSRVAQVLVIGFSLAVVVMAGWLVVAIMISHDANTMAADPAAAAAAGASRVELVAPDPIRLGALASSSQAPSVPPLPAPPLWPSAPYSAGPAELQGDPPPSTLAPAAPQATTPQAIMPKAATLQAVAPAPPPALASPTYTTSSVSTKMSEANSILADDAPTEAQTGETAVVPLPPPKPRRVAAIPVPRPRPHLDSDDVPQERSFFDFLVNRQR